MTQTESGFGSTWGIPEKKAVAVVVAAGAINKRSMARMRQDESMMRRIVVHCAGDT